MDKDLTRQLLAEKRKLERQARQLLYKMEKIAKEWDRVKSDLKKAGQDIPHQLGDVLHGWRGKSLR